MTENEIKKALYKEKPDAIFVSIHDGIATYYADLKERVFFKIPVDDMGDAVFHNEMESQLLIRWIYTGPWLQKTIIK